MPELTAELAENPYKFDTRMEQSIGALVCDAHIVFEQGCKAQLAKCQLYEKESIKLVHEHYGKVIDQYETVAIPARISSALKTLVERIEKSGLNCMTCQHGDCEAKSLKDCIKWQNLKQEILGKQKVELKIVPPSNIKITEDGG